MRRLASTLILLFYYVEYTRHSSSREEEEEEGKKEKWMNIWKCQKKTEHEWRKKRVRKEKLSEEEKKVFSPSKVCLTSVAALHFFSCFSLLLEEKKRVH